MINIICVAMKSQKTKKQRMKIRLLGMAKMIPSLEELPQHVLKLLDVLNKSADNFMVIGKLDIFNYESIDIAALEKRYCVKSQMEGRGTHKRWSFAISNIECTINGYNEQWLTSCEFC